MAVASGPRSVASGVALNLGLISTSVTLFSALDKTASGNVLVCDNGHPAARIRAPHVCDTCKGEVPVAQLKKARLVEGGLVVLDAEDLVRLNAGAEAHKKKATVTAHPAGQVGVLTTAGEKMYFLTPMTGHEMTYATLLAMVAHHDDLAFMTLWTPRSAASQFQLRAYNGVLVLQERTRAGDVRAVPQLTLDTNDELIAVAEQILPALVTDYDPVTYADTSSAVLAEIIKGKEVVPTSETEVVPAVPVSDLLAKLRAQLAAAPAATPAAAKKTATAKRRTKAS